MGCNTSQEAAVAEVKEDKKEETKEQEETKTQTELAGILLIIYICG